MLPENKELSDACGPEFVTAREAALLLKVKPQTLYTYVSRGLLRSVGQADSKEKLYARADLVRLIVAEGPRFPAIADFYYREVVSKGVAGMRAILELGIARGEIANKNLARFPQILVAPALIAVIWQSLFARHAPLDAMEMLRTHLDLIFGERRAT